MSLRAFLVEDLASMRSLMQELFGALGGVTLAGSASNEAEALMWLEENRGAWDLAIIDLILEQGSGISVIARAKAAHPAGRIVVFSSYASTGIHQHCVRLGADAVIDKSDTQAFVAWLHRAQREHQTRP